MIASCFVALVRRGFSQRRKQLAKLLKAHLPDWPQAAEQIGAGARARAEELSLEQWIALTNLIRPVVPPVKGTEPEEPFAVVDEMDRVIGAAPRSEVHGNNLRHRAVHIFIFNRGWRSAFAEAFALEGSAPERLGFERGGPRGRRRRIRCHRRPRIARGTRDCDAAAARCEADGVGGNRSGIHLALSRGTRRAILPGGGGDRWGAVFPARCDRAMDRAAAGRFCTRLSGVLARQSRARRRRP